MRQGHGRGDDDGVVGGGGGRRGRAVRQSFGVCFDRRTDEQTTPADAAAALEPLTHNWQLVRALAMLRIPLLPLSSGFSIWNWKRSWNGSASSAVGFKVSEKERRQESDSSSRAHTEQALASLTCGAEAAATVAASQPRSCFCSHLALALALALAVALAPPPVFGSVAGPDQLFARRGASALTCHRFPPLLFFLCSLRSPALPLPLSAWQRARLAPSSWPSSLSSL